MLADVFGEGEDISFEAEESCFGFAAAARFLGARDFFGASGDTGIELRFFCFGILHNRLEWRRFNRRNLDAPTPNM